MPGSGGMIEGCYWILEEEEDNNLDSQTAVVCLQVWTFTVGVYFMLTCICGATMSHAWSWMHVTLMKKTDTVTLLGARTRCKSIYHLIGDDRVLLCLPCPVARLALYRNMRALSTVLLSLGFEITEYFSKTILANGALLWRNVPA
jgi:hypothetical protein